MGRYEIADAPWPLLGDCDDNVDVFWTLRLNSVTVFPVADEVTFTHSYAPSKKTKKKTLLQISHKLK